MPDRTPILPPLRRTAADAEAFARVVHAGQVDKAGRPYVEHPERVAKSAAKDAVKFYGFAFDSLELDELRQIAWLHDVLEPDERPHGHVWSADLQREGFDLAVIMRVEALCRDFPGLPYQRKIEWVIAQALNLEELCLMIVKLADIEDNADPERLALLPDDVRARLERKYGPALEMLRAAVEECRDA